MHLRKGFLGPWCFCGHYRSPYLLGKKDDTTPYMYETTCKKCITAANKWLNNYLVTKS